MSARDPFSDDRPEIVPPAELLRLRARLSRPPSPVVRAQHLAAAASAARQPGVAGQVGRFATRGARVAVAVVASLAITSGLAAAQVLPQPAQRLLSNVSDRFSPEPDAPPARSQDPSSGGSPTTDAPSREREGAPTTAADDGADPTTVAPVTPTTAGRVVVAPSTTIPGPVGPGSPTDPTDPGPTDPTTTTTVDPGSTTTTTTDPGSTTTTSTTTPGGSTTTTTEGTSP